MTDMHDAHDIVVARIKQIEISNYKGIDHGVINLGNCDVVNSDNSHSSILGIYGPNGSGKSSVVEALNILKRLLSGQDLVFPNYASHINQATGVSKICYTIVFGYSNGDNLTLKYEVELKPSFEQFDLLHMDESSIFTDDPDAESFEKISTGLRGFLEAADMDDSYPYEMLVVSSEKLSAGGLLYGKQYRSQTIIDTTAESTVFKPVSKLKELIGDEAHKLEACKSLKEAAAKNHVSFVFSGSLIKLMQEGDSPWADVLADLYSYGSYGLYVADSESAGSIRSNQVFPFYVGRRTIPLHLFMVAKLDPEDFDGIKHVFEEESKTLDCIVPGLSVFLEEVGDSEGLDGSAKKLARVMVRRNGVELALRDESDGIKRLVSMLHFFTFAFNNAAITVVIDELDSGIFEFLLGELLLAFQEAGKGQLVFTSHNLRPLEVLDKRFLYFSTTNAENRFIQLKGIHANNNLRMTYFRDLLIDEQDEQLYDAARRHRIITALGEAFADDED